MDPSAEIASYKLSVETNVTTKVTVDSISPVDVGDMGTDLADLLLPYLEIINNQGITGGTAAPSDLDGADLDLYYRINGSTFYLYRKEAGTWVPKVTLSLGIILPDGPWTLRASIEGFNVTVTPGSWIISNVVYSKATPTFLTVDAADLNFDRYDLIYANTSGDILYLAGTSASSPNFPATPANSIVVDYVIVPSSSSGNNPYLFYGGSGSTNNTKKVTLTFEGSDIQADSDGYYIDLSAFTIPDYPQVGGYIDNVPLPPLRYYPISEKIYGFDEVGTTEVIKLTFI